MRSLIPVPDLNKFEPTDIKFILDNQNMTFSFENHIRYDGDGMDNVKVIYSEKDIASFIRDVLRLYTDSYYGHFRHLHCGHFGICASNYQYSSSIQSMKNTNGWILNTTVFDPYGYDPLRYITYNSRTNEASVFTRFNRSHSDDGYRTDDEYMAKYIDLIRKHIVYHDYQHPDFSGYDNISFVKDKLNIVVVDNQYCIDNGIDMPKTTAKIEDSIKDDDIRALIIIQKYIAPTYINNWVG